LGFDPGINKCGYGLVSKEGSRVIHIDNGLIQTKGSKNYFEKLSVIYSESERLIAEFRPDIICMETAFYAKNIHSTIILASARTAAILAFIRCGRKIEEFSPKEVKKSVCGNGNASKSQIQEMVKVILGLPDIPYEDAADALAIALSGAFRGVSP
ncbi:MAG: crossover junction endodeoxyribonuclease RuvC, partial [Deltaproteobacteria bacterium]|nr:crossover junction endodeoxyribonuclease RuvC [Deltaproteobacteria bacterium]